MQGLTLGLLGALVGAGGAAYYFSTVNSGELATVEPDLQPMAPVFYGGGSGGGFSEMPSGDTGGSGGFELPDLSSLFEPAGQVDGAASMNSQLMNVMQAMDDPWALASLGFDMTGASAATFLRDGANTSLVITKDKEKYSPADIKEFVDNQLARGVPATAGTLISLSKTYGLPVEQIGAAYGFTPSQTYSWMQQNETVAPAAQVPAYREVVNTYESPQGGTVNEYSNGDSSRIDGDLYTYRANTGATKKGASSSGSSYGV